MSDNVLNPTIGKNVNGAGNKILTRIRSFIPALLLVLTMGGAEAQSNCYDFSQYHTKAKHTGSEKPEIHPFLYVGSALHNGAYQFVSLEATGGIELEIKRILLSIEFGVSKPIRSIDKKSHRYVVGLDLLIQGSVSYKINEKFSLGIFGALSTLEEEVDEKFGGKANFDKGHLHDKIIDYGLHGEYKLTDHLAIVGSAGLNTFNVNKKVGTTGTLGAIWKFQ